MAKLKVKKGDEVIIITGSDKGKQGKILKVLPKANKAVVAGINLALKHTKATANSEGGIIHKELPIDISNIAHTDPKYKSATRVGYQILDGAKVKVAKKSGEIIQKI